MSMLVAIVGGECTGKSTLARLLTDHLRATTSQPWQRVDEYLREWCQLNGRTPLAHEQLHIAQEQTRRIEQARQMGPVVADTTALQTAIYSEWVWQDCSLYPLGAKAHAKASLTFVTDINIPWQADGQLRDGADARTGVDHLLRRSLGNSNVTFSLLTGSNNQRMETAKQKLAPFIF